MLRRAFTLIEVLLAMAIMMALLMAFFVFLRGASDAQRSARAAANEQLSARTLCDLIERDLMCCIASDPATGPGVKGSATELTILTRGVTSALATDGFEHDRALSDLESASISFDDSAKQVVITRQAPEREPLPHEVDESIESEVAEPGSAPPISESIGPFQRVRFRYFDGNDWHEEFDSLAQGRLPTAVEISLWLDPIPGESADDAWSTEADVAGSLPGTRELEPSAIERAEESAFDDEPALGEEDVPPPDVVRLVIIPDATSGDGGGSEGGS